MTITETMLSRYPSTMDTKSFPYEGVAVTDVFDEFPAETPPEATTPARDTQSTLFDFSAQVEHFRLSFEILNVLEKYGRHTDTKISFSKSADDTGPEPPTWIGKHKFLPHVYHHVQQAQPIQLTMPAFPCKSVCPSPFSTSDMIRPLTSSF